MLEPLESPGMFDPGISEAPWMDIVDMDARIEETEHSDLCCCPVLVILQPMVQDEDRED